MLILGEKLSAFGWSTASSSPSQGRKILRAGCNGPEPMKKLGVFRALGELLFEKKVWGGETAWPQRT
jgi:hypothetical protein